MRTFGRNLLGLATWRPLGTDVQNSHRFWIATWVVLLSFSWLIPNRYHPLTEFYADFWMACCLLIGYIALMWRYRAAYQNWPVLALVLLILAIIPWLQWMGGLIPTRGQASLSSAYLLGAAGVCAGGFIWHQLRGWSVLNLLFAAVLLASLVNTGILLIQYADLYPYDDISIPGVLILRIGSHQRPTGNIAQANIAGTLSLWGAIAAWWFMAHGKIRWPVMVLASAYLMLALMLTQSRIALINLICLAILSAFLVWSVGRNQYAGKSGSTKHWFIEIKPSLAWCAQPLLWLLFALFCSLVLNWLKAELMWGQGIREGVFQDQLRSLVYRSFGQAALTQPWFGFGMTHLTSVQMIAAPDGVAMNSYFFHSHNLVLDLILWFGIPVAVLLVLGLALMGWVFVRTARCCRSIVALSMVFVFALHSMVELPHMWGIMLLPVCWVCGALYAHSSSNHSGGDHQRSLQLPTIRVPRQMAMGLVCVCVTMLSVFWVDYLMIQREFWTLRMDNARIGPRGLDRVEPAILLNHIENRIRLSRLSPQDLNNPQKLPWIAQAAMGFPSPSTHFLYVKALALHSSSESTQEEMRRLNRLTSKRVLQKFERDWVAFRSEHAARNLPFWVQSGALLSPDQPLPPGVSSDAAAKPPEE